MKVAEATRTRLLACGAISSPLYVITDLTAGLLYPRFNFVSQAISELFAIGAPTSGLVVPLFTLYDLLILAFAAGIWVSAGKNRALRAIAVILIASAVNGLLLWNVWPMHMRGAETSFTDTMHIVLAALGALFAMAVIALGTSAFGGRFRIYTFASFLLLVLPGASVFIFIPQVAAGQPTPWMGLTERISTYAYLQWQVALAIVLTRAKNTGDALVVS
jgi:hypothetical protein